LDPLSSEDSSPFNLVGVPVGKISLSPSYQPGSRSIYENLAGDRFGSSATSSSRTNVLSVVSGNSCDLRIIHGGYRQDKIRAQIRVVQAEIASLERVLEFGGGMRSLGTEKVREKLSQHRLYAEGLRKELERLISGQLRQRKFRDKMKRKIAELKEQQ
ncbi:hypothetical protein SK128_023242, partial [Halocaridina rubra]